MKTLNVHRGTDSVLTAALVLALSLLSPGCKEAETGNPFGRDGLNGSFSEIDRLLAQGADINMRWGNAGSTALIDSIKDPHKLDTAAYLLEKGADVNAADAQGNTPLHHAAMLKNRNGEAAKLLLAKNADVRRRNARGESAWDILWKRDSHALSGGETAMSELLLEHGFTPESGAVDDQGRGWLHLAAARTRSSRLISLLIEAGLNDVNARDRNGWTPMHHAAKNKNCEAIRALLFYRAEINARTAADVDPICGKRGRILGYTYPKGSTPADVEAKAAYYRKELSAGKLLRECGAKRGDDIP